MIARLDEIGGFHPASQSFEFSALAVGCALWADPLAGWRGRRRRGRRGESWDWRGGDVVVIVVELEGWGKWV